MASQRNTNITEKINDLTESLHRTTDVLSTADRMIDHYRDLNNEQENEIARLQNDISKMNEGKQKEYETDLLKSLQETVKKSFKTTSTDSSDEDYHKKSSSSSSRLKKRKSRRSKVHFSEDNSSSDEKYHLKSSLRDISRRQEVLEREIHKDRSFGNSDLMDQSNKTTYRKPSFNHDEEQQRKDFEIKRELEMRRDLEKRKELEMNSNLLKIQEKIAEDHSEWKKQKQKMETMTNEMKALKDVVIEATTPKPKRSSSRIMMSEDNDDDEGGGLKDELKTYKKRLKKEEETITLLKDELRMKETEKALYESKVGEIQSLGHMKTNQMKLLEEQLNSERLEKEKLQKQLEDAHKKVGVQEKEHSELLLHLSEMKARSQTEQVSYEKAIQTIPNLKRMLEKSERHRDKYADHVTELEAELQTKGNIVLRLTNQLNDYSLKVNQMQDELQKFMQVSDERLRHNTELKTSMEQTKGELLLAENKAKEYERNREELKEKALQAIRDYKAKCRHYEKQLTNITTTQKAKELELSKELSYAKEVEISKLKLQKEFQERQYEVDRLKHDLSECQNTLSQVSSQKSELQNQLMQVGGENKKIELMTKELQELRNQKLTLENQLLEEKKRRKEFESLLHDNYEKTLSKNEESSTLQRQLLEERNTHAQTVAKLKDGYETSLRSALKNVEEKHSRLFEEKQHVDTKCRFVESKNEDLETRLREKEADLKESKNKCLEMVEKLKNFTEENHRLQGELEKRQHDYKNELKNLHRDVAVEKDDKTELQKQFDDFQIEIEKRKKDMKLIFCIISRDVDNLVNLLTEEEENILPEKDIPETMTSEHRKKLLDLRESLDTCYSISKTLKKRFQQQKVLIKKSQERLRMRETELEAMQIEYGEKNEGLVGKLKTYQNDLKTNRDEIKEKDKKLEFLQNRVQELTKHLEQCTRALHKSIEVDKERKNVIQEIELLKNEHAENKVIDENFYRCSEKIDTLTAQLSEARNSLTQIKQDTLDTSTYTSRLIETFGSVSPSKKKRTFSFNSPKLKSTASKNLFTNDSSSHLSFEDLDNRDIINKRTNPISMTDEEFLKDFLPSDASETKIQTPVRKRETRKEKEGRSKRTKKVSYDDEL